MIEDSDSDSDIIAASPQVKKTKAASRTRESPRKRKAVETTPDDFFGNGGGGRAKKVAKSESNGKCTKSRTGRFLFSIICVPLYCREGSFDHRFE